MTNEKLRIGIIGIGGWALISHIPNLRKTGKVEIVAICRRNAKALARAQEYLKAPKAYTDWRALLDKADLDAVLVITPHHLHCEPTLAALERGLHVLVQKPMALTSQEAWTMVDTAERVGRVLTVVYGQRGSPRWRAVKRTLAEGAIGQVAAFQESAGLPVECYIGVQARLANGILLSLTSADMPVDSDRWAIYGDKGMLTVDGSEVWLHRQGEREKVAPDEPKISPDEAFVATVTEGTSNLATGREGAYDVALIEAAYRSAKQGRIISIQ